MEERKTRVQNIKSPKFVTVFGKVCLAKVRNRCLTLSYFNSKNLLPNSQINRKFLKITITSNSKVRQTKKV